MLDRVTVLVHHLKQRLIRGILQEQIQRGHAPLDVQMTDDQRPALLTERRWRDLVKLLHQFVGETIARKHQIGKLLRIRHPPRPIAALHQAVLGHDLLAAYVFRRGEAVLDDFEHKRIRRQGEHAHHHALDPGSDNESIARRLHVPPRRAVIIGFAVLVKAHAVVEF